MLSDPEAFWDLLTKLPWHADTLLQLSEVYRHREGMLLVLTAYWPDTNPPGDLEYAQAVDFVDRALFTYERSFLGNFTFTSGTNRLDFEYVENRPFFLAIHREVTYVFPLRPFP
jgi:Transcriptional repressor TCF25